MDKKNVIKYAFLLSGWVILILVLLFHSQIVNLWDSNSFENQEKKYPLLSKRILNEFQQDILINFLDLRKVLRSQVEPYGDNFGFYFEYLPTGTSIGVNEKNEFYAASLFKVPVIMAYYRYLNRIKSDEDLDKEINVEKDDIDSQFGSLWKLGEGSKIKTSEAIRLALEESDNTAAKLIARRIMEEDFNNVYEGLDIELQTASGGAVLTAKNYTSILKALYFSAVLEKDDSNQILNYLTQSEFNNKLVAGIPQNVKVAHKIGEYRDEKGDRAYMDCGIVYVPKRPYTLCMVSISDEKIANERMSKLSKTIYDFVSSKE